ncbi:hypothetical protein HD554DRAFT_2038762 [Boletus coccyginus]|nr:hypothetical protein HD554DRAFT_2038762 [Boletus coccyginus]
MSFGGHETNKDQGGREVTGKCRRLILDTVFALSPVAGPPIPEVKNTPVGARKEMNAKRAWWNRVSPFVRPTPAFRLPGPIGAGAEPDEPGGSKLPASESNPNASNLLAPASEPNLTLSFFSSCLTSSVALHASFPTLGMGAFIPPHCPYLTGICARTARALPSLLGSLVESQSVLTVVIQHDGRNDIHSPGSCQYPTQNQTGPKERCRTADAVPKVWMASTIHLIHEALMWNLSRSSHTVYPPYKSSPPKMLPYVAASYHEIPTPTTPIQVWADNSFAFRTELGKTGIGARAARLVNGDGGDLQGRRQARSSAIASSTAHVRKQVINSRWQLQKPWHITHTVTINDLPFPVAPGNPKPADPNLGPCFGVALGTWDRVCPAGIRETRGPQLASLLM